MASAHQGELPRLFRRLFHGGNAALLSDEELLDRFVEQTKGAEAAFEAIVSRHGPMVLGVCRRILGEQHAAEDAFQATFLLLVRRAERLRFNETLGPWLHEVARRTALKVCVSECRRHTREQRVAANASSFASTPEVDDELGSALHEEIDRLPIKHRAPVVLCYLEGLTHEAAAEQLGWPVGTVRGRLARARDQLRSRLTRRGLSPTMLLAGSRWEPSTVIEVPALLREALLGSAMRRSGVATEVSYLIKQVSEHLFMLKLKLAVATSLAVALLVAGAGLAVGSGREAQPPPPERTKLPIAAENRSEPGELPLPKHAIARLGTSRFHNGDLVNNVLYTPDGKSLITYGSNQRVRVWDGSTGRLLRDIGTPKTDFRWIALSGDGKTLATAESPGRIRLWDPNTGQELRSSVLVEGDYDHLAYSSDGKRLAAAVFTYDIERRLSIWWIGIWDAATLKQERRIDGDWNRHWDLKFSPDGKTLAVAYRYLDPKDNEDVIGKGAVKLWDVATGKELSRFAIEQPRLNPLAFSPDGKTLVMGASDGTIRSIDLETGKQKEPGIGPGIGQVNGGPKIEVEQRIVKAKGEKPLAKNEPPDETPPVPSMSLAFSPDGKVLASGEMHLGGLTRLSLASIHLWDVATGKELRSIKAHRQWVSSLSFSPDGKTLASTGVEPIVRLWDVESGREALHLRGHLSNVLALAVSPTDGTVFTGGFDCSVRHWDSATGRELAVIAQFEEPVYSLAVSPDGTTLVCYCTGSSGEPRPILLWNVNDRREVVRFELVSLLSVISPVPFSSDGKRLAAGMRLWDVASGKVSVSLLDGVKEEGDREYAYSMFFLGGDRRILSVHDGGVRDWDALTGRPLRWFMRGKMYTDAFALTPDGRLLATGGMAPNLSGWKPDPPIRLWELASGKQVMSLGGDDLEHTRDVAFSPDGRYLASSHGAQFSPLNPPVRVWDIATGKEALRLEGHLGGVNKVVFSKNGNKLISAGNDAIAMVWDVSGLPKRIKDSPIDNQTFERYWNFLAGDDAPRAYRTIDALSVDAAIPYLRDRCKPVPQPDPARLAQSIKDLNSDQFAVRERATNHLNKLGHLAVTALRQALANKPSAEVKNFAEKLFTSLQEPGASHETLRTLRAISALEHNGSPAARTIIEKLATGATEAPETEEAKAALERLNK